MSVSVLSLYSSSLLPVLVPTFVVIKYLVRIYSSTKPWYHPSYLFYQPPDLFFVFSRYFGSESVIVIFTVIKSRVSEGSQW